MINSFIRCSKCHKDKPYSDIFYKEYGVICSKCYNQELKEKANAKPKR